MIIHMQTTLNTIFGVADNDGNIVKQIPVKLVVNSLKPEVFLEALKQLQNNRKELLEALQEESTDLE